MREAFVVALVGEEDRSWLVEAASAEEAIDIVHGTVPRAREVWRGELLVWNERYDRDCFLGGAEMPAPWSRLGRLRPGPCRAPLGTESDGRGVD